MPKITMGIFGKMFGSGGMDRLVLSEHDAFVAMSLLIAGASGYIGDGEANIAAVNLSRMNLFRERARA